eukprot:2780049-Amphidinium_carterae.2
MGVNVIQECRLACSMLFSRGWSKIGDIDALCYAELSAPLLAHDDDSECSPKRIHCWTTRCGFPLGKCPQIVHAVHIHSGL